MLARVVLLDEVQHAGIVAAALEAGQVHSHCQAHTCIITCKHRHILHQTLWIRIAIIEF